MKIELCFILVDLQVDAQNSYLFAYNTFIKILHMFRTIPCSSSGGLLRNGIRAALLPPRSEGETRDYYCSC
jgi:hypothetical protein